MPGIAFDFTPDSHLDVITNKNAVFAGTPYADYDFTVTVIAPTREKIMALASEKVGKPVKARTLEHSSDERLFLENVVSWDICDAATGEKRPCTPESKAVLVKNNWQFAMKIVRAMLDLTGIRNKKEDDDLSD